MDILKGLTKLKDSTVETLGDVGDDIKKSSQRTTLQMEISKLYKNLGKAFYEKEKKDLETFAEDQAESGETDDKDQIEKYIAELDAKILALNNLKPEVKK